MEFNAKEYQEKGLELLKKLIAYPTVLDEFKENDEAPFGIHNKEALCYLLDYASNDGFEVENVDNYAGSISFGEGKETLGILAHLDVVPTTGQKWDTDPFELVVKGSQLFGRGIMDDKGPLVAAYLAMKMLKEQGFVPQKKVKLIVGCDEETGSRCLKHYFSKRPVPELGFSPDAEFPLIYGEKAHAILHFEGKLNSSEIIQEFVCGERYNVVPAYAKMKLQISLENEFIRYLDKNHYIGRVEDGWYIAEGVASHAMTPQKGLNAGFILFDFLNECFSTKLSRFFVKYFTFDPFGKKLGIDINDPLMKELTCNVGIIKIQNDRIFIGVDCRVPVQNYEEKLSRVAQTVGLDAQLEGTLVSFGGYHYVDPKSKLVTVLMDAYKEVTKDMQAKPMTIGGGTYAKFIENGVAFGPLLPGREDVCHIANECMYISDFLQAITIYAKAIYELTKDVCD